MNSYSFHSRKLKFQLYFSETTEAHLQGLVAKQSKKTPRKNGWLSSLQFRELTRLSERMTMSVLGKTHTLCVSRTCCSVHLRPVMTYKWLPLTVHYTSRRNGSLKHWRMTVRQLMKTPLSLICC